MVRVGYNLSSTHLFGPRFSLNKLNIWIGNPPLTLSHTSIKNWNLLSFKLTETLILIPLLGSEYLKKIYYIININHLTNRDEIKNNTKEKILTEQHLIKYYLKLFE